MSQYFEDLKAVELLMNNYFKAVYESDVETLKTIFHEKATMNGYLGDACLIGDVSPFYADLASKPSMASDQVDCKAILKNVEVYGNIASATLYVDRFFNAVTVADIFHLIKEQGRWFIICKTFTTL